MDVLRDTHAALLPGGSLLDFHPVYPPWATVETAGGRKLGELREPTWLDQVRQTEIGMARAVELGLFRLVMERRRAVVQYYEDGDELLSAYEDVAEDGLRERARKTHEPVQVTQHLDFRLYERTDPGG